LVAKGKFYSALVQMLGTRSVVERLTQFLNLQLLNQRGTPTLHLDGHRLGHRAAPFLHPLCPHAP